MSKQLMKCGCFADSLDDLKGPYCSLHCESRRLRADLTTRQAACIVCGKLIPSKVAMLDFEFRPDLGHDYYNCGGHENG